MAFPGRSECLLHPGPLMSSFPRPGPPQGRPRTNSRRRGPHQLQGDQSAGPGTRGAGGGTGAVLTQFGSVRGVVSPRVPLPLGMFLSSCFSFTLTFFLCSLFPFSYSSLLSFMTPFISFSFCSFVSPRVFLSLYIRSQPLSH